MTGAEAGEVERDEWPAEGALGNMSHQYYRSLYLFLKQVRPPSPNPLTQA